MNRHGLRLYLAHTIAILWLAVASVGLGWSAAPRLLGALGNDLLALSSVIVVALAVGVPLGAVAGSGPRWLDAALAFTTDWIATLPAVLLLAFLRPTGLSWTGALLLLGALRALEVAWVVRSALLRAAVLDPTWAARSLGYMPFSVFVVQRLPAAAGPVLAHLALTPLWIFVLDAVASAAGLPPASSERSLGALAVGAGNDPGSGPRAAAIIAVLSLTWALHRLGARYALRLVRK